MKLLGVDESGGCTVVFLSANFYNRRAGAYCARSMCVIGCLDNFFSRLLHLLSFSLSVGQDSIKTEKLSPRPSVLKITNQPLNC